MSTSVSVHRTTVPKTNSGRQQYANNGRIVCRKLEEEKTTKKKEEDTSELVCKLMSNIKL